MKNGVPNQRVPRKEGRPSLKMGCKLGKALHEKQGNPQKHRVPKWGDHHEKWGASRTKSVWGGEPLLEKRVQTQRGPHEKNEETFI